jgi:hypothetical protein
VLGRHPESIRETLQRRLTSFTRRPVSPETLAAEYPGQLVVPPSEDPNAQVDLSGIDFAEIEARLFSRGHSPAVSMGTAVHDSLEGIFQAPAPPDESNPVSRRIRGALRAVVGSEGEGEDRGRRLQALFRLSELGAVSRRTLLEAAGLDENAAQEELEEAIRRAQPPQDPIRGRQTLGVVFDDAAHFDVEAPVFDSDRHISDPPTPRQAVALEHFRAIYGGDPGPQPAMSSGIEPPFQSRHSRTRTRARAKVSSPEPPKDRSAIPTRYNRKPVI